MLNPANNEYAKLVNGLNKRLRVLENNTQPQRIDWYEFNPSDFVYAADDRLITDNVIANQLDIGDKVRVLQADSVSYKYFYIVDITTATATSKNIYLHAGVDYVYTNAVLSEIGFSEAPTPAGHPVAFRFEGGAWYTSVNNFDTEITTTSTAYFYMTGAIAYIDYSISSSTLPAGLSTIALVTPFLSALTATTDPGGATVELNTNLRCTYFISSTEIDGISSRVGIVLSTTITGSNFTAGDWFIRLQTRCVLK